jgi:hypothetical protein
VGKTMKLEQIHVVFILFLDNLRLLVTTNTLLNAIAPAASMGFKNPKAAIGINIILYMTSLQ